MTTILTKKELVEKLQKELRERKILTDFFENVFLQEISKFNGKVLNKRFFTHMNELAASEINVDGSPSAHNEIWITYNHQYKENYYASNIFFELNLNKEMRIISKSAMAYGMNERWYNGFKEDTEGLKRVIQNYDIYLEWVKELEKAVIQANEIPYAFRKNIRNLEYSYFHNK